MNTVTLNNKSLWSFNPERSRYGKGSFKPKTNTIPIKVELEATFQIFVTNNHTL